MIKVLKYIVWFILLTGETGCTEFDFSGQTNKISLYLRINSIVTYSDSMQIHLFLDVRNYHTQVIQDIGHCWSFIQDEQWNCKTWERWESSAPLDYWIQGDMAYIMNSVANDESYGAYITFYKVDTIIKIRGLVTFADSITLYSNTVTTYDYFMNL